MINPSRLKISSTIAPANALENSCFLDRSNNATNVLVMLVPKFAPNIIGTALDIVKTPPATKPTARVVVKEELWTRLVAKMPINSATKGLDVVEINVSANFSPNISKPADIRLMLRINR